MEGFGEHSEQRLEGECACAEEVYAGLNYSPVDEGDMVP